MLGRGLVAGFGALALVVGLLVVFGDDGPDDATGPAAEALTQRVDAGGSSTSGKKVVSDAKGSSASSESGAAATGTASGSSTTAPGAPGSTPVAPGAAAPAAPASPGASPVAPSGGPAPTAGPVVTDPPPPPPPSTAPPRYPSATVAPGPGASVTVVLSDFPSGVTASIACYHIIVGQGPAQFDGYSATIDGSGSSTTSACVWNQPGTHVYVLVTAPGVAGMVGSNHYQFPG